MPVRIYDIAKKLGLENKEILTKAKELGIAAAKVPSSARMSAGHPAPFSPLPRWERAEEGMVMRSESA